MRILYIFTSASSHLSSVQRKVLAQMEALIANGVECKGLFLSSDSVEKSSAYANVDFVLVPKIKAKYFRSSKQKTAYFQALIHQECVDISAFDYIYFRYPGAHKLLKKWLENGIKKVFFEHVTAETEEIKLYKKENPLKFNLSSILSHLEFYFLPLFREKLYGKKIRKLAQFAICNSEDIAQYERKLADNSYQTIILGDAVQTKNYELKRSTALEQEFRMVFLKGASTQADFNGLDKVFRGIKAYSGPYKLNFFLFGHNLNAEKNLIKELGIEEHVHVGGFLDQNETDVLMNQVHLGIGALAIHRKGLKSSSTIKTREYFARGLPFVFGHNDPDFSNNQRALRFCLELPANDEALNFEEIISWYLNLEVNDKFGQEMHQFAQDYLDYSIKMKKLISFIQNI